MEIMVEDSGAIGILLTVKQMALEDRQISVNYLDMIG